MYTENQHTKKENKFISFLKFFVLPVVAIFVIVFVIHQFKSYSDSEDAINKAEMKIQVSMDQTSFTPRISSLSKGMDKK